MPHNDRLTELPADAEYEADHRLVVEWQLQEGNFSRLLAKNAHLRAKATECTELISVS